LATVNQRRKSLKKKNLAKPFITRPVNTDKVSHCHWI
jgi:DUF1365 family protein